MECPLLLSSNSSSNRILYLVALFFFEQLVEIRGNPHSISDSGD